jgi:hypothetical protein
VDAERGRTDPDVHDHVEHPADGAEHVLGLARRDEGEVHAAQGAAPGHAVVGLRERQRVPGGLAEEVRAVPLDESTPRVPVRHQVQHIGVGNGQLADVHGATL